MNRFLGGAARTACKTREPARGRILLDDSLAHGFAQRAADLAQTVGNLFGIFSFDRLPRLFNQGSQSRTRFLVDRASLQALSVAFDRRLMDSQKNPPSNAFHCVYHAGSGESTHAGAPVKPRKDADLSAFPPLFVTPEGSAVQGRWMFPTSRGTVLLVLL